MYLQKFLSYYLDNRCISKKESFLFSLTMLFLKLAPKKKNKEGEDLAVIDTKFDLIVATNCLLYSIEFEVFEAMIGYLLF